MSTESDNTKNQSKSTANQLEPKLNRQDKPVSQKPKTKKKATKLQNTIEIDPEDLDDLIGGFQ